MLKGKEWEKCYQATSHLTSMTQEIDRMTKISGFPSYGNETGEEEMNADLFVTGS